MATRLAQLRPAFGATPALAADMQINFICPSCFRGRVVVNLRLGEARDGVHGSNVLAPAWDSMTITPSIAAEGTCRHCPGWHGFVQGGLIVPDPQPFRRDDEDPIAFARLEEKYRERHDNREPVSSEPGDQSASAGSDASVVEGEGSREEASSFNQEPGKGEG